MRTLAEFTKTPLIGGVLTSSWHLHFSPIFDPSSPKTAEIHRFPSATAAKAERAADRSPKITPVKGRREGGSTFIDRDCPLPRSPGRDGQGCEDHPPIHCHGLEPPVYGPRPPQACRLDPYKAYLQERITAYPQLSGRRLLREVRDLGYGGGYTAITDFLRTVRPPATLPFEVRFETPPGRQAQGDFAQFQVIFTDEPAVTRIVWPPTVSRSARQLRGS
jgi:hypothetical protein